MSHVSLLRPNLTTLFLVAILGIALTFAIPVVFPEILYGSHMTHILLHAGGMTLAMFITVLAVLSYRTVRSRRLLLTMVAFANFMFTEVTLFVWALDPAIINLGEIHIWELGHLLMFVTLGLLALGVLRDD